MTFFIPRLSIIGLSLLLSSSPAYSTPIEGQLNKIEPAVGNSQISTDQLQEYSKSSSLDLLDYNVYAGGLHALRASLELGYDEKSYAVSLNAKTNGFIGKIFPWSASYKSSGLETKTGDLIPIGYEAQSKWKKKLKTLAFTFNDDGSFKEKKTTRKGKTQTQDNFKQELTLDAVDMLTGTIKMLQTVENKRDCTASIPVFDGKRRFNMNFKNVGVELIKKSKYSSFSGKALKCIIEVEPIAGFKKKDMKRGWIAVQEHSRKRKKLPTIWLGELKNGHIAPVRMEINSDYGAVIAHLTQATETKVE